MKILTKQERLKLIEQGANAFNDGGRNSDCPYIEDSEGEERALWLWGFWQHWLNGR